MRIAIMLDRLSQGGYAKAACEEVRNLNKMGHKAELLIIMREKYDEYRFNDFLKGIKVRFLSDYFPKIFRKSFKFPFFSFFSLFHLTSSLVVHKSLKKNEFDIIVAHGTYTYFAVHAIYKKLGIPYVLFIWDPISYILPKAYKKGSVLRFVLPILTFFGKKLDKKIIKDSLGIITCSKVHMNFFKQLSKNKVYVSYPGCFPMSKITPPGDYILAVTKWDIGKRPDIILDAYKLLPKKLKLIVAGFWVRKSVKDDFLKKVNDYGLSDWVEVQGPADKKKLRELYSNARILIHPLFEAFGMICLEAAECGCSFIIPKGSGVNDIFSSDEAFFPKEHDVISYAKYLSMVINNKKLAEVMGKRAWHKSKKYTWMEHTKSLLKCVNSVLKCTRKR